MTCKKEKREALTAVTADYVDAVGHLTAGGYYLELQADSHMDSRQPDGRGSSRRE
jgi:hypothetical protein